MAFAFQQPIRPDAPWLVFIQARERLLSAFHAWQRARPTEDVAPNPECASPIEKAFVRFSLAVDWITVPRRYWSELPHEDVNSAGQHELVVAILNSLEKRFRSLADLSPLPTDENAEEQLLSILEEHTKRFAAAAPSRQFARTRQQEDHTWPHDGSYSRG
ncbi:hypothetical protein JCM10207_002893 [Rhodosporidiobolus poonsookiae]